MGLCVASLEGNTPDVVIVSRSNEMLEKIAPQFLSSCQKFSNIRAVPGYIGNAEGKRVALQGLGYGDVSAAMYMAEIIDELHPQMILKVDQMFSINGSLPLGTIVMAQSANTTSKMNRFIFQNKVFPAAADFNLMNGAYSIIENQNVPFYAGSVLTMNTLHETEIAERFAAHGTLAVDLEINQVYTPCNLKQIPVLGLGVIGEDLVSGSVVDSAVLDEKMAILWSVIRSLLRNEMAEETENIL